METKDAVEIALHSLQRIEHSLKELEANAKRGDSDVWHKKRDDGQRVTVKIRCNIISIGEIDTVKQEFAVELWLSASWKEPLLAGKTREEVDWDGEWQPRLVFFNATVIDKIETKHHLNEDEDSDDGIPIASLNIRLKATFKEPMELYDFPFDYQDLTIRMMSDWPDTDLLFVKNMAIKDSIRRDTFTGAQEWVLHHHVFSRPVDEDREMTGSHRKYPLYHITTHVSRRIGYYLWNVALIMFLIVGMSFASFSVDPAEPADRLSVTLTLLLTSVAFKFVVSQSLPTISYLTILVRACQREMKVADDNYKELCDMINENWKKKQQKKQKMAELMTDTQQQQQPAMYELQYREDEQPERRKKKKHKRSKVKPNESQEKSFLQLESDPSPSRMNSNHAERPQSARHNSTHNENQS
ncbi:cys-loop ligand-gated ion channel-like isoform X2 [Glandiceps talaboti]